MGSAAIRTSCMQIYACPFNVDGMMNLRSHIHSSYNRKLRFVNCLAQISARHCW